MGLAAFCLLPAAAPAQDFASPVDPSRVLGAAECSECHSSEETVWVMSSHFRSNDLHRDPRTRARARDIAARLGLYARDIPTHARCVGCHATTQKHRSGVLRVVGGVSCESCHGGGLDYTDIHSEVGDYASRAQCREIASSKGMRYPRDAHKIGAACFQCHVVNDEELVNVGGHPARSAGFDLVAWSQGEMRHNFYDARMKRHKTLNHVASLHRRRLLYVTGLLLDLEYSLRALANGKQRGNEYPYRQAMGGRAHTILEKELPALIDAFGGIEKTPAPIREIPPLIDTSHLTGPSPRILAAAIAIEQKVAAFVESRPRSLPAALDSLIPAEPVGTPYQP